MLLLQCAAVECGQESIGASVLHGRCMEQLWKCFSVFAQLSVLCILDLQKFNLQYGLSILIFFRSTTLSNIFIYARKML